MVLAVLLVSGGVGMLGVVPAVAAQAGDDGVTNWDFVQPVTHQKTVPAGYIAITTAQQLSDIRNNLSGKYILMKDIDLARWGSWEPIGDTNNPFYGVLDGNGYVLENLTISITSTSDVYAGLFGRAKSNSIICNLGIINGNINVDASFSVQVGAILGATALSAGEEKSVIENCLVRCDISAKATSTSTTVMIGGVVGSFAGDIIDCNYVGSLIGQCTRNTNNSVYLGGIVGWSSANVINCRADAVINALSDCFAGGIVGVSNLTTSVKRCFADCNFIISSSYLGSSIGGIIGNLTPMSSSVDNCYASFQATIQGKANQGIHVGGIAGYVYFAPITQSYAIGNVTIETTATVYQGGIVGNRRAADASAPTTSCYYLDTTASTAFGYGNSNFSNVTPLTASQMRQQASFAGFDFDTIWSMPAGGGYPVLRGMGGAEPPQPDVYAVNYNANCPNPADVANMPYPQIKTQGVALPLSDKIPTRAGYIFKGWGTTPTRIAPDYLVGASYTADASITLWAVWAADDVKKAIIVVPGICGSELWNYQNNAPVEQLWLTYDQLLLSYKLNQLKCNAIGGTTGDIRAYDKPDSSYGTWLLTIMNGIYTPMMNKLTTTFGDAYDVQFFPYDWRLTNSKAADELNAFIEAKGYDKVVLVGHSMGGIVSSLYLSRHGQAKLEKLITLGTPYYGSPKALYAFETGNFLSFDIQAPTVKDMIPNMPGVYELLPSSRYFSNGEHYVTSRITGAYPYAQTNNFLTQRSWYNPTVAQQATALQNGLNATYDKIINGTINAYVIVGYNVKTISAVHKLTDLPFVSDVDIDKYGDGTVPLVSSVFNRSSLARAPYYVNNVDHTGLAHNKNTVQLVVNIVSDQGDTTNYAQGCDNIISRAITTQRGFTGNKIVAACPVTFTVDDKQGNWLGTVSAETISAATGHDNDFYVCGENNETKIAFIDEEADIVINGTGSGTMNFTVEKYVNGTLIGNVVYRNVPITTTTIITTTTEISGASVLNVDANGDGTIDSTINPNSIQTPAIPNLTLSKNFDKLNPRHSGTITATGADGTITWSLRDSDSKFATIDQDGTIHGKARGTILVTAKTATQTQALEVKVEYSFWQWLLVIFMFGWIWVPVK
jgi:pimeloyl-ACP methyl ester carboxylesterase